MTQASYADNSYAIRAASVVELEGIENGGAEERYEYYSDPMSAKKSTYPPHINGAAASFGIASGILNKKLSLPTQCVPMDA